jgi:hypothetical protein
VGLKPSTRIRDQRSIAKRCVSKDEAIEVEIDVRARAHRSHYHMVVVGAALAS